MFGVFNVYCIGIIYFVIWEVNDISKDWNWIFSF